MDARRGQVLVTSMRLAPVKKSYPPPGNLPRPLWSFAAASTTKHISVKSSKCTGHTATKTLHTHWCVPRSAGRPYRFSRHTLPNRSHSQARKDEESRSRAKRTKKRNSTKRTHHIFSRRGSQYAFPACPTPVLNVLIQTKQNKKMSKAPLQQRR